MVKFLIGVKGRQIPVFHLVLITLLVDCVRCLRPGAGLFFGASFLDSDAVPVSSKGKVDEVVNSTKINATGPLDDAELMKNAYCTDLSADCEEREHLCENAAFHDIMLDRCPRTCNLCDELLARGRPILPDSSIEYPESEVTPPDYPVPPEVLPIVAPETSAEITSRTTTTTTTLPTPLPMAPPAQFPDSLASFLSLNQLVGSAERYLPDLDTIDQIYARAMKRTSKAPTCKDYASDCESKTRLCSNLFYIRIMERFCRKTCGYCDVPLTGGSEENSISEISESSFEVEFTTPRPRLLSKLVKKKKSKPKKTRGKTRGRSAIRATSTSSTCVDYGIDCSNKRSLCTHAEYTTLMTRMCANTCNLCTT
uniref:ShKT domain-containing protein n=1 Tax=Panagrellus redivivus TaxID=6233 RepID=A0A7E4W1D2_PANRE